METAANFLSYLTRKDIDELGGYGNIKLLAHHFRFFRAIKHLNIQKCLGEFGVYKGSYDYTTAYNIARLYKDYVDNLLDGGGDYGLCSCIEVFGLHRMFKAR